MKPKVHFGVQSRRRLLIIDELGYFPFERQSAHLFFQWANGRYEKGSLLVPTNQRVSERGASSETKCWRRQSWIGYSITAVR
jgi:DNA replication protein DnaC